VESQLHAQIFRVPRSVLTLEYASNQIRWFLSELNPSNNCYIL
jgi:hypothetical protein